MPCMHAWYKNCLQNRKDNAFPSWRPSTVRLSQVTWRRTSILPSNTDTIFATNTTSVIITNEIQTRFGAVGTKGFQHTNRRRSLFRQIKPHTDNTTLSVVNINILNLGMSSIEFFDYHNGETVMVSRFIL
jgi:hypothetical protein